MANVIYMLQTEEPVIVMPMITRKLPLTLLLMMLIILAGSSMLVPVAYATPDIVYSDPQDGYGTATVVSSVGTSMLVGDAPYDLETRSFVKFSLSGISGTLTSARLYLYVYYSKPDGGYDDTSPLDNPGLGDVQVIHIADYGTLDTADFSLPSIGNDPGVLIPGTGPGSTPNIGYVSVDVKAAMQDDINNGRPFTSFMLKPASGTDLDGKQDTWHFRTSEQTGTDQDPYIEYTLLRKPVGGVLMPVNKLEILTPYLALAGLVIAVSAVVVVKKRSKD